MTSPTQKTPPVATRELHVFQEKKQAKLNGVKVVQHSVSKGYFNGVGARYLWSGFIHFVKHLLTFQWGSLLRKGADRFGVRQLRTKATENVVMTYSGSLTSSGITYDQDSSTGQQNGGDLLNAVAGVVGPFLKGGPGGQDLLEIPLNTLAGREVHAVSLVIDKTNKKVYVLDTHGYDPANLPFYDPEEKKATAKTVENFLEDLMDHPLAEFTEAGWEVETTVWTQKPRDCVFTVEAMIAGLAKQMPDERTLDQVQCNMHHNYSKEVDALREQYLANVRMRSAQPRYDEVDEL